MFAKRHYEAIARVMQETFPQAGSAEFDQHTKEVQALADMLEKDNPLFDKARFCRACFPGANVKSRKAA